MLMFIRADRLLRSHLNPEFKHVLEFHWEGFEPHLMAYDPKEEDVIEIDLWELDLEVIAARRCVGSFEEEGYRPCPTKSMPHGHFAQCDACASAWIPIQECVFEPQCNGEKCDSPFCSKKHVIYAAFHGDIVKVGMTGSQRWRERAIEQGADGIALLLEVEGRHDAREKEKAVAGALGCTQAVRGMEIRKQLSRTLSAERLAAKHESILARLENEYPVLDRLEVLDAYPMQRFEEEPVLVRSIGRHQGQVLGLKGRFIFFRSGGEVRMLDISKTPSHFIIDRCKGII
jgi:hypothetical protein